MKISLVLGSGGARGYAHIGVLQELRARGHEVVAVAGASMGALVGGALAAGKLDEFTEMARQVSKRDVWLMFWPSLTAPGLVKAERVMALLRPIIGEVRIEELPIPYTAVATDLIAQREVWFHEGPLLAAIRASISIPGVFPPVMLHGRLLTDGGLVNPLPMETSMRLDADLTVAVSLFGRSPGTWAGGAIEVSADEQTDHRRWATLSERIAEVWPAKPRPADDVFDPLPEKLSLEDMLVMSLDVMQARIQASRTAVNPPDVHIEVPANLGTMLDFADASRIIQTGRELAIEAFDEAGL